MPGTWADGLESLTSNVAVRFPRPRGSGSTGVTPTMLTFGCAFIPLTLCTQGICVTITADRSENGLPNQCKVPEKGGRTEFSGWDCLLRTSSLVAHLAWPRHTHGPRLAGFQGRGQGKARPLGPRLGTQPQRHLLRGGGWQVGWPLMRLHPHWVKSKGDSGPTSWRRPIVEGSSQLQPNALILVCRAPQARRAGTCR